MDQIIITSIICGSVLTSILSVLVYFAKFHQMEQLTKVYQDIEKVSDRLSVVEDDLRKINNKMRFK